MAERDQGVLAENARPPGCARTCYSLLRLPVVAMMQTAQYGAKDELFDHLRFSASHWLARDSLPNALVGSRVVGVLLAVLHLLCRTKGKGERLTPCLG